MKLSNCCNAEIYVAGGTTQFYACRKCLNACDPKPVDAEAKQVCKCEAHFEMPGTALCSRCHEPYCHAVDEVAEKPKKVIVHEAEYTTELENRVASLERSIAFACHLLALGITGYRDKKGTPEETLLACVDRATKEYARIRK